MKILPPRNTPDSFCRLIHTTKSFAMLHGRYFSLWELYLANFMSRLDVIPTFQPAPLHTQGQELRSEQTVIPLHEQYHLYLFLRLNNSETIIQKRF